MDWTGCSKVEVIPGKVSGVPILVGTRVQADSVLDNYQSGESIEDIAYNFDLDPRQVSDVIAFAKKQGERVQ